MEWKKHVEGMHFDYLYGRFQFKMGSTFIWCQKIFCEITLTWIPGSYCQNWIGYCQWVCKPKYRWHCSKAKGAVHKTQKLWECIAEMENKQMEKVERSRETEDNAGLWWNLSSKNTRILIHQESLSRVEKSSSRDNIMCEKPLWNDNITSDKTYSTIQVDA